MCCIVCCWNTPDLQCILTSCLLFVTDAPSITKRLDVHVVFIVLALLVSTATAISNIVFGEQQRAALAHGQYQLPLHIFVKRMH